MSLLERMLTDLKAPLDRARAHAHEGVGEQIMSLALAKVVFRDCHAGRRVRAYGFVRVRAEGQVVLGSRSFFLRGMIPTTLVAHPGAELRIGEGTGFNYGASVEAHERVEIGNRCMIASMARISDRGPSGVDPVVVEDDVWIAHGAILEPGARIGHGSVVSAGSVVTGRIPPDSLALGNPARPMRLELFRGRAAPPASR